MLTYSHMFPIVHGRVIVLRQWHGTEPPHQHVIAKVDPMDECGLPIRLSNGARCYLTAGNAAWYEEWGAGWNVATYFSELEQSHGDGCLSGMLMAFKVMV